ncbi:MAG: hypothetical protein ABJF23_32845 [Bryobacteraceae bacterium]
MARRVHRPSRLRRQAADVVNVHASFSLRAIRSFGTASVTVAIAMEPLGLMFAPFYRNVIGRLEIDGLINSCIR